MKTILKTTFVLLLLLTTTISFGQGLYWNLAGNNNVLQGTNFLGTTTNTDIEFRTFNSPRLYISKGGLIGIATTSPSLSTRMQVNGLGSTNTTASFQAGGLAGPIHFTVLDGGRVGIGTFPSLANIAEQLHIYHASSSFMRISNGTTSPWLRLGTVNSNNYIDSWLGHLAINVNTPTSFVGIGTLTPSTRLHVFGTTVNEIPMTIGGINATNQMFVIPNLGGGAYSPLSQAGDVGIFFRNGNQNSGNAGLIIAPHNLTAGGIRIAPDGKVGIGIGLASDMTGTYKLYVKDGILTERVKVAVKGTPQWADYVFDSNYKLMPLAQVENFILANKHLPDVPSAEQVVKEGIDVAEMDALLLKKVEELTLYIFDLQKQIDNLKKEQGQ